jgi:hypothetical protein
VRPRSLPEFPERFDREVFGTSRIADDPGHRSRHATVFGEKNSFEIERSRLNRCARGLGGVAPHTHSSITPVAVEL